MIHKLIHYWHKRLSNNQKLRLGMTLLVKNEADIIAENIEFHSKQGVDCFTIMDNGSTDGTREILDTFKNKVDLLIIDQPDQSYQQAKWMTQLAFIARDKQKVDLVVSNDADEFWLAHSGNLKNHLFMRDSVVTIPRYNMALSTNATAKNYQFSDSNLVVKNPILFDKQTQINDPAIAMMLIKISPQTIVNPYGLWRLKGGNHRAKHAWNLINSRFEHEINVYHYPIRSFEQFENNIKNRARLLSSTPAKMGDHYRRWVKLYEQGRLQEEFDRFLLSESDISTLVKIGVLHQFNPFKN